ncbi:MAG: UDP-N-acetylmuramate:L-alanyl-gamma-D-glutamyl-meso-diaminopimelate ligase [Myxococcales bacterium]|nr:UDP-N-acetylmuramate:L-alanyl-gamma-D-glutamyl-meso-diaminopimelate ligase [Myxococcales bacterium]
MHVHFVAVAGTGMGSLAGLFKAAGHRVTGSDVAFYPPMGPALARWGIEVREGFSAANLEPRPDLVIIGNVCKKDNAEARAAVELGIAYTSMAQGLAAHVLLGTSPLVVAGTHGKTTTTALAAWLCEGAGLEPGFLVGGLPKNFGASFQLPQRGHAGPRLPLAGTARGHAQAQAPTRKVPFVVEGDEYDTAFFEKTPKMWHYRPEVAVVTSIEHDHVDIYPDEASYLAAFAGFIERVPEGGLIVAYCGDARVVELVVRHARAEIAWYALDGDELHGQAPHWLGALAGSDASGQSFDLFAGGVMAGRVAIQLSGAHNAKNALAALAAVCQGFGVPLATATRTLARFEGVARRQELRGEVRGVRVYDDFAHHPTAVRETLRGLRARHREGALFAVYEPRTATACRALHQAAYVEAFDSATRVVFAPLGRTNIAATDALDLDALTAELNLRGTPAERAPSIAAIVTLLCRDARAGDSVALLSNGAFGGIHEQLLNALGALR